MKPSIDLKLYLENRLTEYGYSKEMTPAKYNAYTGAYRMVKTRLGMISGGREVIPACMMGQAQKIVDEILPPIDGTDMIEGLPRRSRLGINEDWLLTRNACDTPMCTKRIGKAVLMIMRRIHDHKLELYINMDPYYPSKSVILTSTDWKSAANEADDVYRALMTKLVEYAQAQIAALPEI